MLKSITIFRQPRRHGEAVLMDGKSAAECTRMCIKDGASLALVVGNKVYTLKGRSADLNEFADEPAAVTGNVTGSTVAVDTISPAK